MKNGTITQSTAPLVITGRRGSRGNLHTINAYFVKVGDGEFSYKVMFPNEPLSAVWHTFASRRERQYELRHFINHLDAVSLTYRNSPISL